MTKPPADPVDAYPDAMPADPWNVDRLDLEAYLERIGVTAAPPTRSLLDEVHEAHVRTFTFDNIDVLLQQHPGVDLDAVQGKFAGRGRPTKLLLLKDRAYAGRVLREPAFGARLA